MTRLVAFRSAKVADPQGRELLISIDGSQVIDHLAPSDWVFFGDCFDPRLIDILTDRFGKFQGALCDVEGTIDALSVPFYHVPCMFNGAASFWGTDRDFPILDNHYATRDCFNFSVNKKSVERFLLLRLIEWFQLGSYRYTWSGIGDTCDMSPVVKEIASLDRSWLTSDFISHILAPVQNIKPQWVPIDRDDGVSNTIKLPTGSRSWMWSHVQHNLVTPTAVSLLTESSTNCQSTYTFTEKSNFAFLGLTFPIWIGNHGQAQHAKSMGFDVFDDVIDHSYQYKRTLLERCYHALHDNLDLLRDVDRARELRQKHHDRLLANRLHIQGTGLHDWMQQQLDRLPRYIADYIKIPLVL